MTVGLAIALLVFTLLIVCSAFFSSAETALFSLNPIQIHHIRRQRPALADRLTRLLATPTRLLSTVLIGNTIVNVTASALCYAICERLFHPYGEATAIPLMTLILLVFGEVTPKRVALRHAERLAGLYAAAIEPLIVAFTPMRSVLERVSRILQTHRTGAARGLNEDEFLSMVEVGEEEGTLRAEERTMVDGVVSLQDMQASDIMTPRVDLVGIDADDPPEKAVQIAYGVRFRFLPVYRNSLDHIEGFVDVVRFLLDPKHDFRAILMPPFFVPETAPLDTLLTTMQKERKRLAIVVDQFGGTAGLLTRGDILEEIAPDVGDKYDERKPTPIERESENAWLVEGGANTEDVNEETGLHLEAEGADRMAGWVSAVAQRVPKLGDVVEAQGCRATIRQTRRQRVTLVLLERTTPAAAPTDAFPPLEEELDA